MCTAIVSIEPGRPALLVGIRDELIDRAWLPPARHWPEYPGLIGGQDLQAGGTWLAVGSQRVACVLNARGRVADPASRRSRGVLPLLAAAGLPLTAIADFDPFHLLIIEPDAARLASWNGDQLTERQLLPGVHVVVNSGLDDESGGPSADEMAARALAMERARIAYFGPLFRAARRPEPREGMSTREAWGEWLPLVDGDGLPDDDPRALIVRRDLGGGRIWGTTSVSLVALSADDVRFDFSGSPGDAAAWARVPLGGVSRRV